MIPSAHITEWSNYVPWQTNEQVEQDLVISRAVVAIFSDDYLAENVAFRGGTALHKLYLQPQSRYSEDIDLVQIKAGPIGEVLDHLREVLDFLGSPKVEMGNTMSRMKFRVESETPPIVPINLKVEINCREHFSELGWHKKEYNVESAWFTGSCTLTTYELEELLGTKLRALYQRRKGRDLYDLYKALTEGQVDSKLVVQCYTKYMDFSDGQSPSQKQFLQNMETKMENSEFVGDVTALIRPTEEYDQEAAIELVKTELIERI